MTSVEECLDTLRESCPRLVILVIGVTGVGKSTLINNLLGEPVAAVGYSVESATSLIGQYIGEINKVPVLVYDTPGLGDSRGIRDDDYLAKIKKVISDVHVIIYCIKMTETRMHGGMIQAFQQYNKIGINWEKTVFALTFADAIIPPTRLKKQAGFNFGQYFNGRLQEWKLEVPQVLKRDVHVEQEALSKMPIIPTTDDPQAELPTGEKWFFVFLLGIAKVLPPGAMVRFMDIHKDNISYDDQDTRVIASEPSEFSHPSITTSCLSSTTSSRSSSPLLHDCFENNGVVSKDSSSVSERYSDHDFPPTKLCGSTPPGALYSTSNSTLTPSKTFRIPIRLVLTADMQKELEEIWTTKLGKTLELISRIESSSLGAVVSQMYGWRKF